VGLNEADSHHPLPQLIMLLSPTRDQPLILEKGVAGLGCAIAHTRNRALARKIGRAKCDGPCTRQLLRVGPQHTCGAPGLLRIDGVPTLPCACPSVLHRIEADDGDAWRASPLITILARLDVLCIASMSK